MARTLEEARQLVEYPEYTVIEPVKVSDEHTEYMVKEIDAYAVADRAGNKVWLNESGEYHRFLGPSNISVERNFTSWSIEGHFIDSWEDYERLADGRISSELIAQLKEKYGSGDGVFVRPK